MNYEAYRMTFQSDKACLHALWKEYMDTVNALLHARDALQLVYYTGVWSYINTDDLRKISETMNRLETFISNRLEDDDV